MITIQSLTVICVFPYMVSNEEFKFCANFLYCLKHQAVKNANIVISNQEKAIPRNVSFCNVVSSFFLEQVCLAVTTWNLANNIINFYRYIEALWLWMKGDKYCSIGYEFIWKKHQSHDDFAGYLQAENHHNLQKSPKPDLADIITVRITGEETQD